MFEGTTLSQQKVKFMKKRNSILTVDLDAIAHNVRVLQSLCRADVKQMAVVKANAYGHGSVPLAKKIEPHIDWFAVNDIYEAVELREGGLNKPVLVFGVPEKGDSHLYISHNITATISGENHFECLKKGTDYHLNVNSGMNRLGFRPEQIEEVLRLQKNHPELNCTGIYSHFATADEPASKKINQQYKTFKRIREQFDERLLTHMCNTAGMARCPQAQFDLVRTGIGIYGYSPGKISIPDLKPAIQWKTQLLQVNPIKKSETVSYGATWKARDDGYIGIIPVGYSDGIPRGLSGNFEVVINGKDYPVAGTVTMNYCMIDLGPNRFEVGTEVSLWNNEHTPQHWAEAMNTIPYEILTRIPVTITREYIGT